MAIIQKIRNRAGILVAIIIGMALVAFILGDFLTSGGIYFRQKRAQIVEINGKGYSYEIYQQYLNKVTEITKAQRGSSLDEQTMDQVRQQTWNQFVQDRVMKREYKRLGITVSEEEMADLILGDNPHYLARQYFGGQSGRINPAEVSRYINRLNELNADESPEKQRWLYVEDLIYSDQEMTKYLTLINKGLYATSLEIKRYSESYNKSVDFSYVVKRFNEIPDSTISVSESELKDYYKKHQEEYKQEESRDIHYMVWEVVPSKSDYEDAEQWINNEYQGLADESAETAMQYVKSISDIPPTPKNYSKGELEKLDSFAFNSKPGAVYGPYFEDNAYKIAKLTKILYLPDSVKASHILFPLRTNQDYQKAKPLADSLTEVLKAGKADFAELAGKYSGDKGTSQKGGDLGWFTEGRMVQPFSDSCFYGKEGDIVQAVTQYGLHIIKIEKQSKPTKKVRIAVLVREVRPSEKTDQKYYDEAGRFGATNDTKAKFEEATKDNPSNLRIENNITPNTSRIGNMEGSRALVQWAYQAKKGEVTNKVQQFGNNYVIACLYDIHEKGYKPFEEVKSMIELDVKKEKKAQQLIKQFEEQKASTSDINSLAEELNTEPRKATNIKFNSNIVPGLGTEPKLIGASTSLEEGVLSEPINGTNGVYVIQVDNIQVSENTMNPSFERRNIERGFTSRLYSRANEYQTKLAETLDEMAKVKDNRIRFY